MHIEGRSQEKNEDVSNRRLKIDDHIMIYFFLYCVFDWTIWTYVPLEPSWISLIRQIFDGIFYLTIVSRFLYSRTRADLKSRKMLLAMSVVIFSVAVSTMLHQSGIFLANQTVFVVFRYSVILLVPRIHPCNRLKKIIVYTFFVQLIIGLMEGTGILDFRPFLLPAPDRWFGLETFNPTSFREGSVGISSSFLNSIDYSLYLMASYIMLYWRKNRAWKSIVAILVLFVIFKTQSKTSLVVFSSLLLYDMKSALLKWMVIIVMLAPVIIVIGANVELVQFFLENSLEYSRIGFFVYLLPQFFMGNPIHILFGVGIDPYAGLDAIRHYPVIPKMLLDENSLLNLKDVFWIAQLFQWGIIGLASLLTFLISIFRTQKSITLKGILIITFILGLTNQVMEVKIFSFLLWFTIKYGASFDAFTLKNLHRKYSFLRFMDFSTRPKYLV